MCESYDELHSMAKNTKKTILVAEDDAGIIDVMKIILEEEGYTVLTAQNKKEIQTVLQTKTPDLIFLDIRLGGENGAEIAQKLKRNEKLVGTSLILVSGDDQTEAIAREVKATDFLAKPFDIDALLAMVRKHLQ